MERLALLLLLQGWIEMIELLIDTLPATTVLGSFFGGLFLTALLHNVSFFWGGFILSVIFLFIFGTIFLNEI